MTKGQANRFFLQAIGLPDSDIILSEIARDYGTTVATIHKQVTRDDAEFLFEYLASDYRESVYYVMKKANLA